MDGRRLAVLAVAVVALAAAGCGGGGSDEASGDTEAAATETVETMPTEVTTQDTTTTEDTATETSAGVDTSALTGKCAELAGLGTRLAAAMGGQNAEVADVSKLFDELADQVPDEIKDDWEVLARNFQKIADALKDVDLTSGETPSAEALAKLQELSATFDSQEMQQAASNIEAWAQANC